MAALLTCFSNAQAVDLPVKEIAGKEYFVYTAKSGDTSLKVAGALGISSADLLKYNPWAEDGLRKGQTLYFPVKDFADTFNRADAQSLLTHNDISPNAPVHVVKDNETLFGIARLYNISPDQIVALNPWAASGIHSNQRLILPSGTDVKPVAGTDTTSDKGKTGHNSTKSNQRTAERVIETREQENSLTPVNPPVVQTNPDEENNRDAHKSLPVANVPDTPANASTENTHTMALILPLGLDNEEQSKRVTLATDFYRGVLLAADTLRNSSSPLKIKTFDAGATVADTRKILNSEALQGVDFIIGSPDQEQFDAIATFARNNNIYLINSFLVKDSTHLTNPYVIQTYIDQSSMYDKAADYAVSLVESNPGIIPVLLENKHGDRNKEELISIITERLAAKGISPLTVNYDGNLTLSELKESLAPENSYIFLPMSGTLKEFNRFAHSIASYASQEAEPLGAKVMVFGFPEWTAFRASARENLSKINARIYSRFYADNTAFNYQNANDAYKRWFGRDLPSEVPVQALLGFDTALFLINALNTNVSDLGNASSEQGVQSTFNLKRIDNGGLINRALYTIEYLPGDAVNINIR